MGITADTYGLIENVGHAYHEEFFKYTGKLGARVSGGLEIAFDGYEFYKERDIKSGARLALSSAEFIAIEFGGPIGLGCTVAIELCIASFNITHPDRGPEWPNWSPKLIYQLEHFYIDKQGREHFSRDPVINVIPYIVGNAYGGVFQPFPSSHQYDCQCSSPSD